MKIKTPDAMIVFPNAKINLGLRVTSRREDGYHNLETLFMPVRQIRDILEIVHAKESKMVTYGTPLDGNPEDNLCMKALRLMQKEYGIGEAEIHLYKKIPVGAGLGGGSADCAFTLSALSTIFELHLSKERLCALAATLGSDCPFFIYNIPMVARGRGELLTPFDENLLPDF
ncbi:MAG: 4-(cytidine 5'-diphospho)-2-C-methyl-D-erythritol kinase, partial [Bacteroidales bacterium]|nr:4-(cytidine 5'-diphospho)-2-C-methyl-D-erythritol kinase [Bacteroidales bacterium]